MDDSADKLRKRVEQLEQIAVEQQETIDELENQSLLGSWGRRGVLGAVGAALGLASASGSAAAGVGQVGTTSERVDVFGDLGEFNALEAENSIRGDGLDLTSSPTDPVVLYDYVGSSTDGLFKTFLETEITADNTAQNFHVKDNANTPQPFEDGRILVAAKSGSQNFHDVLTITSFTIDSVDQSNSGPTRSYSDSGNYYSVAIDDSSANYALTAQADANRLIP